MAKATPAPETGATQTIELVRPNFQTMEIPIEGTSELIVHKFSTKAKEMMLEAQMSGKNVRKKKDPKDPEKDFQGARYILPDGRDGFPAAGFKAATVDACRYFDGLTMTLAKTIIRVIGEGSEQLVPLNADPVMREDTVRLATGVADLRYRPGYWPWSAVLQVRWNADILSVDSLLNLVEAGGEGGVGEWRPSAPKSKTGTYGCYRIVRDQVKA